MKFKFAQTHRYWWPVTVRLPAAEADRAGQIDPVVFKVRFEQQPRAVLEAASEVYTRLPTAVERAAHDTEQLVGMILDWSDVVDEAGTPVPFSDEALRTALDTPWVRAAIWVAYTESMSGDEARLGN